MAEKKKKQKKSTGRTKMSLTTRLMVVVNAIFILMLLISYLALYLSPEHFWPVAFAGLAYPLLLLINVFFVLFWLVFLKRYFFLSLLAILLGFSPMSSSIRFSGTQHALLTENSIQVMTYNVRLFDLYNWRSDSSRNTRASIFGLIREESPDILCLQEYYSGAGKKADFADTICQQTGYRFRSVELINKGNKGLPYGLAVFSRYPILRTEKIPFPNSKVNFCMACDICIGKDTLRFLNLHLESVKFGREDYNFVSEMTNTPSANDNLKKGMLAILAKMKFAYERRASQIETVAAHVEKSPYPVVLCGDFNDTPVSFCYRQISKQLTDTFTEKGTGLGQTHSQMIPFLRLDYIFHSSALSALEHRTIQKDFSDHFPVITRLTLPD
jgi:endonuclease/exonuclease/phosphatase family metal-dependent hydrolase